MDKQDSSPWDRAPSCWERALRIIDLVVKLEAEGTAAILREERDRIEADMDRIGEMEAAYEDLVKEDTDRFLELEAAHDDLAKLQRITVRKLMALHLW